MVNNTGLQLSWPGRHPLVEHTAASLGELPRLTFPAVTSTDATRVAQTVPNLLLQGDNGLGLRHLLANLRGKVQLIYLDPPFATGNHFRQPTGKAGGASSVTAYRDNWQHSEGSYLNHLEERLSLARELLAESGSLYLHLDYRMAPVARLLLDEIFGSRSFVNEIIWYYRTGGMPERLGFGRKHDTLLFYVKDPSKARWHRQQEKSYLKHRYGFSNIELHEDEQGIYTLANMRDVWDIPALRGNQPERVAYPTQKPVELLERIIKASSDPGDLVLDPYAGSGTALVAAEKLQRRWIGLDSSPLAIAVIQQRLLELQPRRAFELQSLQPAERKQWFRFVWNNEVTRFKQVLLHQRSAAVVTGKMYHGVRGDTALLVVGLSETLSQTAGRRVITACHADGFRRLEILTTGSDRMQREGWHRVASTLGVVLTVRSIPHELAGGKSAGRRRLNFNEQPRIVWRRRTLQGRNCLELVELLFDDPSPQQQEQLEVTGWRGLVGSWWVRDRAGSVSWHSGGLNGAGVKEQFCSGPLPEGARLRLEIRDLHGDVW